MNQYRVYPIDPGGKIISAEWIAAENLETACKQAQMFFGPGVHAIELWIGAERLAVIDSAQRRQPGDDADPLTVSRP